MDATEALKLNDLKKISDIIQIFMRWKNNITSVLKKGDSGIKLIFVKIRKICFFKVSLYKIKSILFFLSKTKQSFFFLMEQ